MTRRKREVNAELSDVWAMIMYEKLDQATERKEKPEYIAEYSRLDGYINGISMSLSIFTALKEGKLAKDYERLLKLSKGV